MEGHNSLIKENNTYMKKKLSTNDNLNLQPVRSAKGKQIIGMQVRVPLTQSDSQFLPM